MRKARPSVHDSRCGYDNLHVKGNIWLIISTHGQKHKIQNGEEVYGKDTHL